jgi:hypothetical protein
VGDKNICHKIYFTVVDSLIQHTSAKRVLGIDIELMENVNQYQMKLRFNSVTGGVMSHTLTAIISKFVTQEP